MAKKTARSRKGTAQKKSSIEGFFTYERANLGKRLDLKHPDGSDSQEYLMVRHITSDPFRKARALRTRENARILAEVPVEEQEAARYQADTVLLASLIADWSFEEPVTEENVVRFLSNAPLVREEVDNFAIDNAAFFGKR